MRVWVVRPAVMLEGIRRIICVLRTFTGLVRTIILTRRDRVLSEAARVVAARMGRVIVGVWLTRLTIGSVSRKLVVLFRELHFQLAPRMHRDAVESGYSGLYSTLLSESSHPD
jgi:hypothetical protein